MSGVLRWEEPPEAWHGRPRGPKRTEHWQACAEDLIGQPGRFGVVLEGVTFGDAGGIAGQIKRGAIAAFRPAGHFEAQTRTTDAGYAVYARYIGEGS